MKKLTKVLSLVLALALVLMSVNIVAVNAYDANTVTLTIKPDDENDDDNHTYVAYQIFKGTGTTDSDVDENNTFGEDKHHTLSNIDWGVGVNGSTAFLDAILTEQGSKSMLTDYDTVVKKALDDASISNRSSANDFAAVLSTILDKDESRAARMLALVIKNAKDTILKDGVSVTQSAKGENYTATLPEGYYIILDTAESGTASDSMLLLLGDQEVSPKHQNASVEKAIVDDESGYSVGDKVDFMVKLHLPSNVSHYGDNYVLALKDELTNFKLNTELTESVKVYIDSNDNGILDGEEPTNPAYNVTDHFDIHIGNTSTDYPPLPESYSGHVKQGKENDKALYVIHKYKADLPAHTWAGEDGKVLFVTYSAEIDAGAVVTAGDTLNKFTNTAQLTYSNDPDGTSVGLNPNTPDPDPQTTSYSFKLQIDKVDGDTSPLNGAGFTLEKLDTANSTGTTADKAKWIPLTDGTNVQIAPSDANRPGTDVNTFRFAGLGDGIYRLTETKTPSGYNTIDPQYIKIDSTKKGQELDTLTGMQYDSTKVDLNPQSGTISVKSDLSGSYTPTTLTGPSGDEAKKSGTFVARIQNLSGINLPETGGMGTKIFYTLGGVLVVGAVILLVVKRRMRAE